MNLPFLTADVPGIGGAIKQRPEDFFVEEIPLYEPSGAGEHIYVQIEKIGISTFQAIDRIAAALRLNPRDIGFAGMKDANAITRQVVSILGTSEEAVMKVQVPGVNVQWAARHGNKLRLGHLKGNRFAVKIRGVRADDVVKIAPVMDRLARRGMPNFYGPQRFSRRENNHLLGAALIGGDDEGLIKGLLGGANEKLDEPRQQAARAAFDSGDLEGSMRLWPRHCGMERRVLARFIKTHRPGAAVRLVDQKIRRLWISALQSAMFNETVTRRIESLDKLMDGDLAEKHDNGAVFLVESAAAEQSRCDAFEISPTGPLLGYRMTMPEGKPLEIEQAAIASMALKPEAFRVPGRHKIKGARRSLRVRPVDVEFSGGADEHGQHVTVAFTLPAGAFATVLLRELMKGGQEEAV